MNLFQKYGIKEVADVVFYSINEIGDEVFYTPVLYLDTLKVSTIEKTAEKVDARGGYGNKKLITWNVVSLVGYVNLLIMIVFIVMLGLAASQLNIKFEFNKFVFDNMLKHIIFPYVSFYKTMIIGVLMLLIGSMWEKRYYDEKGIYGYRVLENYDRIYSFFFLVGLALNFLPLYLYMMYVISLVVNFI